MSGRFAQGGAILGPVERLNAAQVGRCAQGHTLWSVNGGAPEHFIAAAELRTGEGQAMLDCPNVVVPGCCTSCEGTGTGTDAETNGLCWDCRGTGHPHDGPCDPGNIDLPERQQHLS